MAKKRNLKGSEARILCYLSVATENNRFVRKIASKLDVDYGYITKILSGMVEKGWLQRKRDGSKVYFGLNKRAPLQQALDFNSK